MFEMLYLLFISAEPLLQTRYNYQQRTKTSKRMVKKSMFKLKYVHAAFVLSTLLIKTRNILKVVVCYLQRL